MATTKVIYEEDKDKLFKDGMLDGVLMDGWGTNDPQPEDDEEDED